MMRKTAQRTCTWCGASVPGKQSCEGCRKAFASRPSPETLSADEREAEMRALDICEVPFEMIHKRIEQLVGRPVWTHEMGLNWEGLCKEARWEGRPATMAEIIELIPPEKRVAVTTPECEP